jgi:uncharacterized membrane protein YuzA (DUF378 family)
MSRNLNWLDWVAFVLVIVGALNWGLVGFFNYNLVDAIFGTGSTVSAIIYAVVGLSGLYVIYSLYKISEAAATTAEERMRTAA